MRIPTVEIEVNGRKKIVNADDPRAAKLKPGIPSKSDIATMKKADVVEWLEAHGVDAPDGKVLDLRKQLTQIMWADL